jgi:hypothetical protein
MESSAAHHAMRADQADAGEAEKGRAYGDTSAIRLNRRRAWRIWRRDEEDRKEALRRLYERNGVAPVYITIKVALAADLGAWALWARQDGASSHMSWERADLRGRQRYGEGAGKQEQGKRSFRPTRNKSQLSHGEAILSQHGVDAC